ncbi:hypothetical protein DVK02_14980 [Halobellus sp. Atlit-31R]|nr:hypothetical protein DVK02_14980 [Halobellus sp. Atlit-31R]
MTENLQNLSKDELIDRVERLEANLQDERTSVSRRGVLRGGLTVTGLAGLLFATHPVMAASGVYPVESEPPFAKIRAERIRYDTRTSQPSAPSSGRVISYVDDGDLP